MDEKIGMEAKLKKGFDEGYLINKWEGNLHENSRLPRFISEYLYYEFMKKHADGKKENLLNQFYEMISTRYPEKSEKEKVKHMLISSGSFTLIDEFNVTTDLKHSFYWLAIPSLDIDNATVDPVLINRYEILLKGGSWGLGTIEYDNQIYLPEENGIKKGIPVVLTDFTPFQPVNINVSDYVKNRSMFSLDEWIDLLMNSIGVNPEIYKEREKIIFLTRLIPMVENNLHMIEIGPRATGKSYLYRNISFYTRLIAGGTVSPAMLFYNMNTRKAGEITARDAIAFDEINRIHFYNQDEMISKLKDYMDSGNFERGYMKGRSTCSFVFMGNSSSMVDHALPEMLYDDTAFVDRIAGILPGWGLPKLINPDKSLSHETAFRSDYLAVIMHMLRSNSYSDMFNSRVELYGDNVKDITIRDWKAITRIASGLIKVLYPDGKLAYEDISLIASVATELRNGVLQILHAKLPAEFVNQKISFRIREK